MRQSLVFWCTVSLGVGVIAPAQHVFAQAGVCRKGNCPCSAETESKLEHTVLREITSRRAIWDSGEEFLSEGRKEAEEEFFHSTGTVSRDATVHVLLHGLLHEIAAGAATPVLIAEATATALEVGLSTAEARRAIADAQKKYDRALSDAGGLDKKIERDLTAEDGHMSSEVPFAEWLEVLKASMGTT